MTSTVTADHLGRWVVSGNSGSHTLCLVNSNNGTTLATVSINTSGAMAGQYLYGTISNTALTNGTTYNVLTAETNGGDQWYDDNTAVTLAAVATAIHSVFTAAACGGGALTTHAGAGFSYGPVNLQYH